MGYELATMLLEALVLGVLALPAEAPTHGNMCLLEGGCHAEAPPPTTGTSPPQVPPCEDTVAGRDERLTWRRAAFDRGAGERRGHQRRLDRPPRVTGS